MSTSRAWIDDYFSELSVPLPVRRLTCSAGWAGVGRKGYPGAPRSFLVLDVGFVLFYYKFFFFVFLLFLGLLPQHMEIPRLGVESEL